MNPKIHCPVCDSFNTKLIFVKDSIPYFDCSVCAFRFSKSEKNANFQDEIDHFEDAYIQYFDETETDELNYKLMFSWLEENLNLRNKNVLDIGCGSGKWVQFLATKNISAKGIEPSEPLFNKYLKGDSKFFLGDVNAYLASNSKRAELVFALDVLEHVDQPKIFLESISSIQLKGDFLVLEVPIKDSLTAKLFGKNWHFYNKYHLSYFSKKRLDDLLKETGYVKVFSKHRGKYFKIKYIVQYLFNFIFKKKINGKFLFSESSIYLNTHDIYFVVYEKTSEN